MRGNVGIHRAPKAIQVQFSSRPSLVRSVTVVLLSLVTGGKGGEGRLVKPGLCADLMRRLFAGALQRE